MIASSAARTPTLDEKKNETSRAKNFDTSTAQLTATATACIPLTRGGRLLLEAFCQMPTTFTLAGGVGYHIVQGSRARRDARPRPHLDNVR
jgi:hypothetical protein